MVDLQTGSILAEYPWLEPIPEADLRCAWSANSEWCLVWDTGSVLGLLELTIRGLAQVHRLQLEGIKLLDLMGVETLGNSRFSTLHMREGCTAVAYIWDRSTEAFLFSIEIANIDACSIESSSEDFWIKMASSSSGDWLGINGSGDRRSVCVYHLSTTGTDKSKSAVLPIADPDNAVVWEMYFHPDNKRLVVLSGPLSHHADESVWVETWDVDHIEAGPLVKKHQHPGASYFWRTELYFNPSGPREPVTRGFIAMRDSMEVVCGDFTSRTVSCNTTEKYTFVIEDGYVKDSRSDRIICWVPYERRPSDGPMEFENGRITIRGWTGIDWLGIKTVIRIQDILDAWEREEDEEIKQQEF